MTKSKSPTVWSSHEKPFIVFMVPADRAQHYAVAMQELATSALVDLKWSMDSIDIIGLMSSNAHHGTECIYFLEDNGVNTRSITLLMMWGETAECVGFDELVPEECGVGSIVLPETGAVLPVIRMPSLDSEWWSDPVHKAYATTSFTRMFEHGRVDSDFSKPFVFVAAPQTWN